MSGLRSWLYWIARTIGTAEALLSGSPRRIGRRAMNLAIGRTAARAGIWRRLWEGGR